MFTTKDVNGNTVKIADKDIIWEALYCATNNYCDEDYVFIPRAFPAQPMRIPGKTFTEMCRHLLVKFA